MIKPRHPKSSIAPPALIGGSIDFAGGGFANILKAYAQGKKLVAIAPLMNRIATNVVIRKSIADELGVTSDSPLDVKINALKGLKIGTNGPGALADLVARDLLGKVNLDPEKDVTLVALKGSAFLPAFSNGQIDAFVLSSPTADAAAEKFEGMILIRTVDEGFEPQPYQVLYTTPEYLQEHPDVAVQMVKSIVRAAEYINSEPDAAFDIVRNVLEGPQFSAEALRTGFDYTIRAVPNPVEFTEAGFSEALKFFNNGRKMAGDPPLTIEMELCWILGDAA